MNTISWHGLPPLDPACPDVKIAVHMNGGTQTKLLEKHIRNDEEAWSDLIAPQNLAELRRTSSSNEVLAVRSSSPVDASAPGKETP